METRDIKLTCPNCGVVNDYELQEMNLIDDELNVTYFCACGCRYTNRYALVYLGGHTDEYYYDRDNLMSDH